MKGFDPLQKLTNVFLIVFFKYILIYDKNS